MESNVILAQVKALRSYLTSYLENLKPHTGDENFEPEHTEMHKIYMRYRRLSDALESLYPDVFSDLMNFSSDSGVNGIEELSRELTYVLETLESINSQGTSFASEQTFDWAQSIPHDENNAPFTEEERKRVEERLNEIQDYLVKTVSHQTNSDEDLKTKVEFIQNEISEVKEAASKLGRRDWRGMLINTMIAIIISTGFAPDARQGLFVLIQNLINLIKQSRLLNP